MTIGTGKVLLEGIGEHRDQWLALRQGKVSSTTITSIVGVNPFKSAYRLWAEWTGKVTDDFTGNDYTDLGLILEPFVGELFGKRSGRSVRSFDAFVAHKDLEWAVATPDFVVDDSELLEVKTGSVRQLSRWHEEQTPDHYLVQLVWQLGVCGVNNGHLAALLGADPENFFTRSFELDQELFSALLEAADNFLQCVKRDEPPTPSEKDSQLICRLTHRNATTKLFTAEQAEGLSDVFNELRELREEKAELDDKTRQLDIQIKRRENSLKVALGDSGDGAFADGRRYRVKRVCVPERMVAAYEYERLYILNGGD